MRRVTVFNFTSLNGYFQGPNGDIAWAHEHGEPAFAAESMRGGSTLLFGRVTYELMASVWPTPAAIQNMPLVAKGMNEAEKVVFSRTLKKAEWNRTTIVSGDLCEEVRRRKALPGERDMTVLGSGSIVTQLARQGLIDELQILVHPVVLGDGTPMFRGLEKKLTWKLLGSRTFETGNVLLRYQPA